MRRSALLKRPSLRSFTKSSVVRLIAESVQFEAASGADIAAASDVTIGAVAPTASAQVIVEATSGIVLGTITGTATGTVGSTTLDAVSSVQIGSFTSNATARNAGFLTIPVRVIPPRPPKPKGPPDHRRRAMQKAWDAWNNAYT